MRKDTKHLKHPLIQAFGLSLKALRRSERKRGLDAAKDLGVGESLYRLLESGTATLQPNKALDLIRAFPHSQIDFGRLSTLLVVFQIIAVDYPSNPKAVVTQAQELASINEDVEELFIILKPIWDELERFSDSRTIAAKLEKNDIPRSLLIFLAQKSGAKPLGNLQWINKQIEVTPPLFLDLAAKLIRGLNQHATLMNVNSVKEWEKEHSSRMHSIFAFVRSLDDVIKTCDEFDWGFLNERSFRQLTIVCWGESSDRKKYQAKLKSLKDKIVQEATLVENVDKFVDRINEMLSLLFIEDEETITLIERNLLEEISSRPWEHAWIYELSPETVNLSEQYFVAIMDNRLPNQPASYECIHCSASLTQSWSDVITTLRKGKKGEIGC